MQTLLVTGGCGFIGSNFIRRFIARNKDWKVLNLDKITYAGNRANLRDLEKKTNYSFVQGDICDSGMVHSIMEQAQAVVHFAAETHVDRSIDNAEDFLTTNILGTRVLLEAARKHKIGKFIHMSTDEVYGSLDKGSAGEEAPLLPNSPYSASKAAGDLLVRSYWKTYDFPAIIVRCTNNYGPYQYPEKVIPLFVTNLLEGKKVPLYGKGMNERDWIYVEDACDAIQLIFDKGRPQEAYNIGAGNETKNIDLTHLILKLMDKGSESIEYVPDRPGHDLRYSVDTGKLKKLGFQLRTGFEEGLKKTIDWYRSHSSWWQPLKKDKFTVK